MSIRDGRASVSKGGYENTIVETIPRSLLPQTRRLMAVLLYRETAFVRSDPWGRPVQAPPAEALSLALMKKKGFLGQLAREFTAGQNDVNFAATQVWMVGWGKKKRPSILSKPSN